LRYQNVDITTLCQDAVAMTRVGEEQPPVRIMLPDAIGTFWGDPSYLQRVLMNVLENALRHTPMDGAITLAARAEAQQIVFEITDTGEGIAPEHLPHLGERFYRIDDARARRDGGTGLGLSICRSIIATHHGAMAIHSTLGQGTRVTISLPRQP
jgi:two-component system sensor histidine kinase BaeS